MCDRHDLVLLGPEGLLDLRYVHDPAKVSAQLVDLGAIRLKAIKSKCGNLGNRERAKRGKMQSKKMRTYQSAKLSLKYPVLSTRALSPGSTRLAETYVCMHAYA
jgi:hypothetical protein